MTKFNHLKGPQASLALALTLFAGAFAGCSSDKDPEGAGGSTSSGGSTSTSGGSTGTSGGMSGGGAASGSLQGNFNIDIKEDIPAIFQVAYSNVIGIITAGPSPAAIQLKSDSKSGECELLVPWAPFCSGGCGTAICTADSTCTPYPDKKDVGTVKITGLGDELTLTVPPNTTAPSYQSATLPAQPCTEGGTIAVEGTTFSMTTKCIKAFELKTAEPIPVLKSKTVDLAWTAAATPANSRVRIHLDIAHHGGKKGEINCDVADTGSFSIPEPLVTKLVGLGLAGYPTIGVERYSVGADSKNANLKVRMSSGVERVVDTGITSCMEDSECTGGKKCDTADKTCK